MPSQPDAVAFNLKDFRITGLKFAANEKYRPGKEKTIDISTQLSLDSAYDEKTKVLSLSIGLKQVNDKAPFTYEVSGVGEFKFDAKPDKESLDRLSTINCPAILFPYLRELIADLTRRGGFTPLHLAPVNFVALAETSQSEKIEKPVAKKGRIKK